jgi:hypothetical protein
VQDADFSGNGDAFGPKLWRQGYSGIKIMPRRPQSACPGAQVDFSFTAASDAVGKTFKSA